MEISIENIGKEQDKYLKSISKGEELWLTEQKLGEVLRNEIFVNNEIISQYKIFSYKVDYVIKEYNLIVEFQGFQHFTNTKNVYNDIQRIKRLKNNGYIILQIPYFIQLTSNVLNFLFSSYTNRKDDLSNQFPHGFIHPKVTLPCDFCKLGKKRYNYFLSIFPNEVKDQCERSIRKRGEIDNIPYWRFVWKNYHP